MKLTVLHLLFPAALGLAAGLPVAHCLAADTNSPATSSEATPQPASAPAATQPKLPYGVEDIVRLSNARVNENIILTYIQNSGTIYNLGPQDIANLKDAGVSDNVVIAMVDQRRNVPAAAAQTAASAATQPIVSTDMYAAPPPAYVQAPPVAYVQPVYVEPVQYVDPTASTLYIIPSPAARSAYYGRPSSVSYIGGYRYFGGNRGCYATRGWYGTRSGWHRR
jgi:hypothetical protein